MRASETVNDLTVRNRTRPKVHSKGRVQAIDSTDPDNVLYKVNGRWMPSLKVAVVGDIGPILDQGDPYFLGPFAGQ